MSTAFAGSCALISSQQDLEKILQDVKNSRNPIRLSMQSCLAQTVVSAKQASLEAAGADMGSLESLWRDRSMNIEPLELRQTELQEEIKRLFATLQAQVASTVDFSALLETGRLSFLYAI